MIPKKGVAIDIIAGMGKKPDAEQEDQGKPGESLSAIAEEIISAVKSGSAEQLKDALQAFLEEHEGSPEDSEE